MKIQTYMILQKSNIIDMENAVNNAIDEGFVPYGNLIILIDEKRDALFLTQSMVYYAEEGDDDEDGD